MKPRESLYLLALSAAVILSMLSGRPPAARAQQTSRVGLVVDFGDHHITRCVEFSEPTITGYDVLRRAGLDVVADTSNPMGAIVCDINGTSGCPASNCFCRCQGSPCLYWAYHHLVDGSWRYSQIGVSSRKVQHGDVEGWAWGTGSLNTSGAQPPVKRFDEICAPPADTPAPPTSTPAPTKTPQPDAEDTPVPELRVWFRLDENPIAAGSCTMIRWDTANANRVHLDGEQVSPVGSREVCPTQHQEYNLRVVGATEEKIYTLVLGVTEVSDPSSPTPQPTTRRETPTPTPTRQAATVIPSATPTGRPSPAASPSATPQSTSTSSPTATPTPTPTQMAEPPSTPISTEDISAETAEQLPADPAEPASPYPDLGYAVFGVITVGLLGWLVFATKIRR